VRIVVAGLGGFMKENFKKEMACSVIFHAGYFSRYVAQKN